MMQTLPPATAARSAALRPDAPDPTTITSKVCSAIVSFELLMTERLPDGSNESRQRGSLPVPATRDGDRTPHDRQRTARLRHQPALAPAACRFRARRDSAC